MLCLRPKTYIYILKSQFPLTLMSLVILIELCRSCLVFLLSSGTGSGRNSAVITVMVIGKIYSF